MDDLGRRIIQVTDDNRERAFLNQRMSALIQRYNAVAILGTFAHTTPEDELFLEILSLMHTDTRHQPEATLMSR